MNLSCDSAECLAQPRLHSYGDTTHCPSDHLCMVVAENADMLLANDATAVTTYPTKLNTLLSPPILITFLSSSRRRM